MEKKQITVLKKNQVTLANKLQTSLNITRKSNTNFDSTINLFSSTKNEIRHLSAITNPSYLSKKRICLKCGISFKTGATLKRHQTGSDCTKTSKFLTNKTLIHPTSLTSMIKKYLPGQSITKKSDCVFVSAFKSNEMYQLEVNFIKYCKSEWQTSYTTASLTDCALFLIHLLPSITIQSKHDRFLSNLAIICDIDAKIAQLPSVQNK